MYNTVKTFCVSNTIAVFQLLKLHIKLSNKKQFVPKTMHLSWLKTIVTCYSLTSLKVVYKIHVIPQIFSLICQIIFLT